MEHTAAVRVQKSGLILAIAGIAAFALSGCVPAAGTTPTTSASASSTPSASASTTPSTTPTATDGNNLPITTPTGGPTDAPTAVSIACGTLLSPQVVYAFNPNFGLQASFTPPAGTPAAVAVADKGVACSWLNQTSRDTFTFSVARPIASDLTALKSTAAQGTAAAGYGDSAWFSSVAGVGRIDVFQGSYWLTATSDYFGSASDASALLKAALAALK